MSEQKHILITGAAGFAGHHCLEHLLEKTDWKITGIVSFRHRGDSLRLQNIKNDDPKRLNFIWHDLKGPVNRLVHSLGKVDYIINYASESHVDRSIDYPVPFVQNNVEIILNMMELAREIKPEIFIQISTDEVYGPAFEPESHKEWSPILPSNPYSASKAAQEAIAISYWRTYGVPLILTNTMNLIGERQDKEKFVPKIISYLQQDLPMPVHGTTSYVGKRHYLHARNLADACLWLLNRGTVTHYEDKTIPVIPDRYNIAGEAELSNLDMVYAVAEILNKRKEDIKIEYIDFHKARPGHDRRYALDSSKIRSEGWQQPVKFADSLKHLVDWTISHPEWMKDFNQ